MPQALLSLVLLAVTFSLGEALDPSKLHGKWHHSYEFTDGRMYQGYTVYHADGTFSDNSIILYRGEEIDKLRIEGTWNLKGRQMTYQGKVIGHPTIPENQPNVTCEILEITEERYSFRSALDGSIQFETRVK